MFVFNKHTKNLNSSRKKDLQAKSSTFWSVELFAGSTFYLDSLWQQETENFLISNPKLKEAFSDPRRIFNQDETSVEIGSSTQRVLAEVNTKILYGNSSGSREHITTSYLCGADGSLVPPCCIYKGVRNVAEKHLKDLPKTDLSGEWTFSVSDKGYITRELYVQVLMDLDKFLTIGTYQDQSWSSLRGQTHISQ